MAAYKDRVKQDLDRWIANGLVDAGKRDAILATLPETRRMDAATALAWVGGLLFGIAVIAFIAANWDVTPKLVRFATLLVAFLGFAAGAAWASRRERPTLSNILLTVAALVFAASIGLTGQIFDIAGDPRSAAYGAGSPRSRWRSLAVQPAPRLLASSLSRSAILPTGTGFRDQSLKRPGCSSARR
ncbi:MAG: DUF2157 domain-containing protein [Caulobacteraceae bacterium]|nr:DUF2157 domain-containing protein [Caulobacteraceae bacterium]